MRTRTNDRLAGVDVARCLALFGMYATHVFPTFDPDGSLQVGHAVAAGRASALFALLAGVGLALGSGGRTSRRGRALRGVRAGVLLRAALLVAVGLALGEVESPPLVILAYYGLLFVVALPFLGLGAGPLAHTALVALLSTPVASHLLRRSMTPRAVSEPGGSDLLVELFLTGTYPVLTWSTYLLAGLAVGRLDLRRRGTQAALLTGGTTAALAAHVAARLLLGRAGGAEGLQASLPAEIGSGPVERVLDAGLYGVTPTGNWRWLLVDAPHSGTTLDLLGTGGTALAVVGACLLLAGSPARSLLVPLAAAGSMTFTLYVLHVLVLSEGAGLRPDERTLWWILVLSSLLLATWWRTVVGRGPLEALASAIDRRGRLAFGGDQGCTHRGHRRRQERGRSDAG